MPGGSCAAVADRLVHSRQLGDGELNEAGCAGVGLVAVGGRPPFSNLNGQTPTLMLLLRLDSRGHFQFVETELNSRSKIKLTAIREYKPLLLLLDAMRNIE